jgi:hypothetical protein
MYFLQALSLSRRPAVAFVIVGLFWGCFAAYVPEVKARLGVNDATFGLLLLCNALGLVSSMFWPRGLTLFWVRVACRLAVYYLL